MKTELDRRRFLLTVLGLGAVLAVSSSDGFAKDGDDDNDDDSGGDSDDNDTDNSGSGSSGSGRDESDDSDDSDDDSDGAGTSGGGTSSSSGGSKKSGSGKGNSLSGKSSGSHKEASDAAAAVKNGKAVSLRKLMSHVKSQYGGKVLDVKLNRGIFRYSYRVKHLGNGGRLQTLRLDALSLKKF